jgi:hypothetical protein
MATEADRSSVLVDDCPAMGIYETLYAFADAHGSFMGTEGTHPWSQGFPLTTQLEGGPPLPGSVEVTWEDRFYPKAWGHPKLRTAIAEYYNSFYGSSITPENVMVFAGGRPAIYTVMVSACSTSRSHSISAHSLTHSRCRIPPGVLEEER